MLKMNPKSLRMDLEPRRLPAYLAAANGQRRPAPPSFGNGVSRKWLTPVKLVAGFTGIMTLLITFAIQRVPSVERIEVPPPTIGESVAVKSDAQIRTVTTDRPVVAATDPVPVVTERIRPDPAPKVPALVALPEDAEGENGPEPKYKRRTRAARGGDVCSRHNMRKVVTRGGKSWRCKRV